MDDYCYLYIPWTLSDDVICIDPAQANMDNAMSNISGDFVNAVSSVLVEGSQACDDWVDDGEIGPFISDIDVAGTGRTLYFLREGIERFMITDINNPAASAEAQSDVTVYFDQFGPGDNIRWSNHVPGGSNVLYMDGHVEFLRYPNKYRSARRSWRSSNWGCRTTCPIAARQMAVPANSANVLRPGSFDPGAQLFARTSRKPFACSSHSDSHRHTHPLGVEPRRTTALYSRTQSAMGAGRVLLTDTPFAARTETDRHHAHSVCRSYSTGGLGHSAGDLSAKIIASRAMVLA